MIHYHGTPVGGDKAGAARFLSGRHALVPFSYPADLGVALESCQSVCLDNGAFTLWKKGGDVDVQVYHEWVHSVAGHPALDWCLIPDKIDGTEQDNAELGRHGSAWALVSKACRSTTSTNLWGGWSIW